MRAALFWILSFLLTASVAVYQRKTGPTYPVKWRGEGLHGTVATSYYLPRSCTTGDTYCAPIVRSNEPLSGSLLWRRYPSQEPFERLPMVYNNNRLFAALPSQPPAGKLEYRLLLQTPHGETELTPEPVKIRFKGPVPNWALIPHIFFIFCFMLLSVHIFLSVFFTGATMPHAVPANTALLLLGGFVFGPIVQHYAFGQAWTGFPLGWDLTDNKTLIMLLAWLPALFLSLKKREARRWIIAAFAVTMAVYLVPHSLYGSQLDYAKGEVGTGK